MEKPIVFLGSSGKGFEIASAIETQITNVCIVKKWSNEFEPGLTNIENLFIQLENCDFAIMVFTPDDNLEIKGKEVVSARDNVIFELGLFMGKVGRERAYIVRPKNNDNFHLPTDLSGINYIPYDENRESNASKTSVTSNLLRENISKKGKLKTNIFSDGGSSSKVVDKKDSIVLSFRDKFKSSLTCIELCAMLKTNYEEEKAENISSLLSKMDNKKRGVIVNVLNELKKEKLLDKIRIGKSTFWKLNAKGYDYLNRFL